MTKDTFLVTLRGGENNKCWLGGWKGRRRRGGDGGEEGKGEEEKKEIGGGG